MSIVWVLVGAFIGWHVPQPIWAKLLQEKVVSIVKAAFSKE